MSDGERRGRGQVDVLAGAPLYAIAGEARERLTRMIYFYFRSSKRVSAGYVIHLRLRLRR